MTVLNRFDDYPVHQTPEPLAHPATSDPNFYNRTWFNGYRDDGSAYFGMGMAVYPHRNILDCHFSVREAGGRQHCFYASRRAPQERTDMEVGPLRLEIIEPLRKARIIIDDNDSGVSCDLTFSARTSALQEARQTLRRGQTVVMDATRFAQFGRWSGTVRFADGELTVNDDSWLGTKDRSWGVRRVGERVQLGAPQHFGSFFFLWAPLQWEDHISHAVFFDDHAGRALVRESLTAPLHQSTEQIPDQAEHAASLMAGTVHRLEYQPETRWIRRAELDLIDVDGSVRTISLEPRMRFQFKGLGYGHREWGQGMWKGELAVSGESFDPDELDPLAPDNVHVQHVVSATDNDGRTGIGALEHMIIGPYQRYGFHDLLDGAQ